MARYPIFADSYSGIGAQLANQEALQQQAIQASQERFIRQREAQQRRMDDERYRAEALRRQAMLDAQNERYLDWQMGAGARVNQQPAAVRTDLFRSALNYAQEHGTVPRGTPPEIAAEIEPIAASVRPELAQRHQLLSGAAEVVNRRNALKMALKRLDADVKGHVPENFFRPETRSKEITAKIRSLRDKYAKELEQIEPRAKMVESDEMLASNLQFDPASGAVAPAYIPEFMRTNAPRTMTRSMTNAVPAPTVTNAPAMRPLDRQTAMQILQQAGGDPNAARVLARQLGFSF